MIYSRWLFKIRLVDLPNFAAIGAMLFVWFSTGLQFYFIAANLYHWDIFEWFRPGGSSEGLIYIVFFLVVV